jgi:hypothetical protein
VLIVEAYSKFLLFNKERQQASKKKERILSFSHFSLLALLFYRAKSIIITLVGTRHSFSLSLRSHDIRRKSKHAGQRHFSLLSSSSSRVGEKKKKELKDNKKQFNIKISTFFSAEL